MAALSYTFGSGMNYASLAAAQAAQVIAHGNLVSDGNSITFLGQQAYAEAMSGAGIVFGSGWTTDATHTITITIPKAYRHTGIRGSGYRITGDFGWYGYGLDCSAVSNVTITGISVQETDSGADNCFGIATGDTNTNVVDCLITDCAGVGIVANGGTVANCMMIGCGIGLRASWGSWGGTDFTHAYNDTILNCTLGIDGGNGNGHLLLINGYIGNSGSPCINMQGSILDTIQTTGTDNGFTGTITISVKNCHFTNIVAGSENLHIASTSYLCQDRKSVV